MAARTLHALSFFLFLFLAASNAQQPYVDNHQLDCLDHDFDNVTKGYTCNGPPSCRSYLTFWSHPPYNTANSIAALLNASASEIRSLNNLTTISATIPTRQLIIIPVNCSCSGAGFYQHNATYTLSGAREETYFSVANETYQALSTCQAMMSQNPYGEKNLVAGLDLLVPLRCACPTDKQTAAGFRYLLTYLVSQGDSISVIADMFRSSSDAVTEANELKSTIVFFFTPLLVPLRTEPTRIETSPSPPPPPVSPPIIPSVSSVDERHKHCTPWFRCGNQIDLYYPFWTPERRECGHPDFEVNCSGDFPEFSMLSVKFRILEMNYGSPIIRLARLDSLNNLCPQHPENATINQQVFSLLPDTELQTFYYNCPGSSIDFLPKGYISHLDCEEGLQIYFVSSPSDSSNRAILDELSTSCESEVYTFVSRSALKIAETDHSLEVMKKALDEGFTLGLNGDCSECVRSQGACGYNQTTTAFVCYCINEPHAHTCHHPEKKKLSKNAKLGIEFTCGFIGATLLVGGLFCFIIRRRKNMATQYTIQNLEDVSPKKKKKQNLKGLIPLKQYTYTEVKRITKSLAEVVGKGGFGTVYRGKLRDGRVVAVKILKESKGDGEDFINEVASMSKTSHVNIVSLLGFCYDGSKRAIIYEYIENGSLDQYFSSKIRLNKDWRTLYEIALGIARGLEYLHNGCQTRIVHFDIKPQNVLLDGNLCPKVSDFGLAKLCGKRESILSLLDTRGTIGYIAPEVFSRTYGNVSYKADVYSYGMLVIEMIGARNRETAQNSESNTSSMYFPEWIYKDLENENYQKLLEEDITVEHEGIVKKMILVGLWCIQSSPSNRPPMNRVIEMLEGSVEDLEVPSKPVLHLAATQFIESSCLLEENSGYSEV